MPISSQLSNKSVVQYCKTGSQMLEGEMWQCSHSECPAMCICNMLLSSLCHAELLKSDWLEGLDGRVSGRQARMLFTLHSDYQTLNM